MKRVSYRGIEFFLPPPSEKTNARDTGMQFWFGDSLRSTLTYIDHIWYCHSQVDLTEFRVLEIFAGVGASSAYFKHKISHHVAFDHDESCIEAFKKTHPNACAETGDSYIEVPKELVSAGFGEYNYILYEHNALTMYRALREPKERALLDAAFKSGAEYILFVDTAKVKEHLHRKLYSNFFAFVNIQTSQDYVQAVSTYIHSIYGYSVETCAHDSLNYSLLFKKDQDPLEVDLIDVRCVTDLSLFKELGDVTV